MLALPLIAKMKLKMKGEPSSCNRVTEVRYSVGYQIEKLVVELREEAFKQLISRMINQLIPADNTSSSCETSIRNVYHEQHDYERFKNVR